MSDSDFGWGECLKRVWEEQENIKKANEQLNARIRDAFQSLETIIAMHRDTLRAAYRRMLELEKQIKAQKESPSEKPELKVAQ